MNKLDYPADTRVPYFIIILIYALYVLIFAVYRDVIGSRIAALAIIPIIEASWYFGATGGVLTAILTILANAAILWSENHTNAKLFNDLGNWIGIFVLVSVGVVTGRLGTGSELCVPIKFKERILDVINAESTKKAAFTEDDERLLITLAGQIATALEQIRKAQAERKWLDQLAHSNDLIYALAQITTHIEKAFSIDDIIRNLGEELSKINLTCIMVVYDRERGLFTVNYTSMDPKSLEIVEQGLGYPLVRYTFSRDRLQIENILYPIALSKPEAEIEMLLARTRRPGISKILQKIGVEAGTEPLRLPLLGT